MTLSSTAMSRASARHPWRTIGIWALGLVTAVAVIVLLLPGTLTTQYTFLGNPDSQAGRDLLQQKLDMPQKANEVVIVRSPSQTASDPAFRAFTLGVQQRIAALGPGVVDGVASYARGGDASMVSKDGRTAIITLTMAGDLTQAEDNIDKVHAVVHAADGQNGFSTLITGTASINSDFGQTANTDLQRGEGIGVPIALVILLIVFGALVAAMIPIFLALIAITFAIALTALVGQTFYMSVFAINMISMMGLATGIDYCLFIVSRFREERARGRDKIDAIGVAGGTATRAVVFSGLTVVLALCGLLIVPTNIFVSLAVGAILVVSAVSRRGAHPAARGARPAGRPREQPAHPVSRQTPHRGPHQRATQLDRPRRPARHAPACPDARGRRRHPAAVRRAGAHHEDRRLRREHLPEQLREQEGLRRPGPPVQRRQREPGADRRRRAGRRRRDVRRRPAQGRARSRSGLRPSPGAGLQDG